MAVFRVIKDKNNPYVIKNTYYDFDSRLSLKAKGLMGIFLSRPDNWKFYNKEILKHCKDGKDSLNSAINELIKAGYIERDLKRDTKGKLLGGYDYSVYEVPKEYLDNSACTKITECGKPEIGETQNRENPFSENPPLLNNELILNNDINSSSNSSKGNMEVFKHFEKCNFGLLSPMIIEKIAADIELYSKEWVMKAAEISDEAGVHRYDYVKSILERWKANGRIKEKKEVKDDANRRNYKKNTGENKSKWGGYKAPTPKLKGETDTTGLI
ncbi:DnaD domain protein [Clostridium botulinum]|uniref:DnaD domain protein n=1 Tax=Clostridium botulinum TaxID=1491 RepID=UPI001C9AF9C1|nr:DnaD domain protein [Clostridium botulinum]MBY6900226.1 DnaD domain protein [Clostridium botulinum]MBY6914339.1 DnaD domain protein [Clostridium botulinum]